MENIETFHNKTCFLQRPLVSDSKQTSSNQYRSSKALVGMDNIKTLHQKKKVVAQTVGFTFEADLFKSAPMILGFNCHGQH